MSAQTSTRAALAKFCHTARQQCQVVTTSTSRCCGLRTLHTTATVSRGASSRSAPGWPQAWKSAAGGYQSRAARVTVPLGLLAGGGLFASVFALSQLTAPEREMESNKKQLHPDGSGAPLAEPRAADSRDPAFPRFRLADVRTHDGKSEHPWVTHEDKVYDMTEWVAAHPGGDVILRAAGGSVDPYWAIFTVHKQPYVREMLDQYFIGFIDGLDLVDGRPAAEEVEDPFVHDPARDPRLRTHTAKPRNAEPPADELDAAFATPNELFYVRNHMWVPVVAEHAADEHALTVELPDGETRDYTLAELKARFPLHRVTAALQCSGNRRSDMTRHARNTNGLQWGVGAISNAEWEGVRLADVLADAGLKVADARGLTRHHVAAGNSTLNGDPEDDKDEDEEAVVDPNTYHVQFSGLEAYGASIPLAKALDPRGDVLLAFGMNGQPLPRDHGFPLRALVPGHVAARSVKWLSRIVVSDEESTTQWQRRDYKAFGPNAGANPDWDSAPAIQEMPVTSAITNVWVGDCVRRGKVPWLGEYSSEQQQQQTEPGSASSGEHEHQQQKKTDARISREPIAMQGYAYSGGGREIARVDVSLDGGKTWDQADLVKDPAAGNQHWSWRRWRYTGQYPFPDPATATVTATTTTSQQEGEKQHCTTLVVKATDEAYNAQPETHAGIYNVRGNLATGWHRLRICPKCIGVDGEKEKEKGRGLTWATGHAYGCGFETEEDVKSEEKGEGSE